MNNDKSKSNFEMANKLIFVEHYEEAKTILYENLYTENGELNFIVVLRLAELEKKLNNLDSFIRYLNNSKIINNLALFLTMLHEPSYEPESILKSIHKITEENNQRKDVVSYCLGLTYEKMQDPEKALYHYKQSVKHNSEWYPAYYGIAEIYYQNRNEKQGDQYFYLYEKFAPYNVYGNIETHKFLSMEFLLNGDFDYAIKSIKTLSQWWIQTKNYCPDEIKIFEAFIVANIYKKQNKFSESRNTIDQAIKTVDKMLNSVEFDNNVDVLLFVAKILSDHDEKNKALEVYKRVISHEVQNSENILKIGLEVLTQADINSAHKVFSELYQESPDDENVRFCFLIARLKLHKVEIEQYLYQRDKLIANVEGESNPFYLLEEVSVLLRKFNFDSDVHMVAAQIFQRLQSDKKQKFHLDKMIKIDPLGAKSKVIYAEYLVYKSKFEQALDKTESIQIEKLSDIELNKKLGWIRAKCSYATGDYYGAKNSYDKILKQEPWNIAYIRGQIKNYEKLELTANQDQQEEKIVLIKDIDWRAHIKETYSLLSFKKHDLAYHRAKLSFICMNGSNESIELLVDCAKEFYVDVCIYDVIKLINTNFDHPNLYWIIGSLYKSLNQLETAYNWFSMTTKFSQERYQEVFRKTYSEMANCLLFMNREIHKAIEFTLMSLDVHNQSSREIESLYQTLTLCFLKVGDFDKAKNALDELSGESFSNKYIKGLYLIRSGELEAGKKIWKSIISTKVDSLKEHMFKRDLLKTYYSFDSESVQKLEGMN